MFGVSFFTPILTGLITDRMSWRWTFGFVAIFSGLLVPLILLFVPEHVFNRDAALARQSSFQMAQTPGPNRETPTSSSDENIIPHRHSQNVERDVWYSAHHSRGWGPFWRQLRLFTGRKSDEKLWKILLRPFPLYFHPAVLWGSLTQGTLIMFVVAVSTLIGLIFGGPPNFFSDTKVGYFYVGPFVGGMIGFIMAGLLSDTLCRLLTKANNRVYEPEFRIVLVAFQLVGAAVGLFPFGVSVERVWSYYVSILLFAFVVFALIMGATATGTYIVDAHSEMAVEAFVCITLFKNFASFGMTLHITDILIDLGDEKVLPPHGPFSLFGSVEGFWWVVVLGTDF
jgi:MFS family permease